MFIGEIEEVGVIEPVSTPVELPREETAEPVEEPVAA
jgi:hypothetical protein